ncbi:secretion protein EspD, partial [Escherichia coli]|nr:secretion protein EspD [Escherichia coli]
MLNVNNDTLSVTSGVNTASGTSGITQSETGLSLDLQLVKSMNSSAGWTE